MFWFLLARLYSKLYGICHDHLGFNLRGMGFFITRVNIDRPIGVMGRKLYFNHHVATCYIRSIDGKWNEPETHTFLSRVLDNVQGTTMFIDVGANIGEMIVDMAQHPAVTRCIAFEPNPECVLACRKAIDLNGYSHVEVFQKAVSSNDQPTVFYSSDSAAVTSSLVETQNRRGVSVATTTLDKELLKHPGTAIILIDVEGAEKLVMEGGRQYIDSRRPLIIFEYHEVTRKHFSLKEVSDLLGSGYEIFRLRHDGALDSDLRSTWNCVAVHRNSCWHDLCASLQKP